MADRYWVGGTDNWNTTAGTKWATTSGGTGGAAVPTASDNVYFDLNSGAVTVTITQDAVCNNLSCTSAAGNFAGAITGSANLTVSGSLTLVSGVTWTFTSRTITFNSTAAGNTITSAGKTLCTAITFNGVGGSWQFVDAATCLGALTLTAGAVDFNNNAITAGTFSSSNGNVRSIAFGTGSLTINGSGANLFNMGTVTNWSYTGSGTINVSNNTATASTITTNGSEAQLLNFYINAGTYTLSETNGYYKTLDLTNFSGTLPNTARRIYGDFVVSSTCTLNTGANTTSFFASSGTQKITTAGKTLDFPITFGTGTTAATLQLQDNLTIGSTRTFTLTAGTLDLTGNSGNWTLSTGLFASSNSNTRAIKFGTANITLTGSGTVWNTGTVTNFSYTGTPTINVSNNSATATTITTGAMSAAQALNFNYTIGTYTLTDTNAVYQSLSFSGFTGTVPNSARTIYGDLTIASGATNSAGTNTTTFAATSGTQKITTNNVTLDYPLTFNGIGGTFAFQDALTQGSTRAFTITNGTVQLKAGATATVGALATSGTNQKVLQSTSAGSQATLSQASGNANLQYLTVKDIAATGGAKFNALNNCITQGNNSGWYFAPQLGRPLPSFAF